MYLGDQLFQGERICLGAIDHEKDAEVESHWTHDVETMRLLSADIYRPLSPEQVKKHYEAIEKEQEENKNLFYFTIRSREDDRLLGFVRLFWVDWTNGFAFLQMGIGDPANRRKGLGTEALRLILRYAFAELNLHRLTAVTASYNQGAIDFFKKEGFLEEVRQRQAIDRGGQRWDVLQLGLLRDEWRTRNEAKEQFHG